MASVLRQRLGASFGRHSSRTHLQHSVHPSSAIAKRFMGGHGGDDAEETFKWRNITIAATIGCVGMVFNTFSGEEHHHPEERPDRMDSSSLMIESMHILRLHDSGNCMKYVCT